jgi:hypothetical protein
MYMIDLTGGFASTALKPVPIEDAVRRILAYRTTPLSGWTVYDLVGITAREQGLFDHVTPWSLLYVNALNGRVDIKEVSAFTMDRRREFARLIAAVPAHKDLHALGESELAGVVNVCLFRFRGAWAPKITKLGI